ncbi:hypothetical protein J3R30DRAFT_3286814 [Lentinula aciculospora]|uniref:Uncharacterized protein n=1 Tax=Lentinula aciculospora TaxID=153920 RepID=A0A9W9AG77_9AGAR|nr:hypothetical protein J3R30DRAFT_3286814 [Lentinula aciculospora]
MVFLFHTLYFLVALLTLTASAPLATRDVYIPHITAPDTNTTWKCGEIGKVTWDDSRRPENVTNPEGIVVLRKEGLEDTEHPLASGFSTVDSQSVSFKIPGVPTRNDYQIVLFGDSGNFSPVFTIKCDDSA